MEIANGVYRAHATSGLLTETKEGKPQVAVTFDLGEHGQITWYGYFTERTIDRTIESLRFCGWTGNDLTDLGGIEANEVELVIEQEEYDGKVRSKVRWVNRLGGVGMATPMSADKARTFAAQMKGKILAYDQANGGKKPVSNGRSSTPPPHTDSDRPPV